MCTSGANSVGSQMEERTQDETLGQEGCARRDAYVPLLCRSLDNAGTLFENPEERKFVIDTGASVHMLSKKRIQECRRTKKHK